MSSPDLAGLSLEALEALSDSDENLRGDIEALEERWMNGCAEACSCTLQWLKTWNHAVDKDFVRLGAANSWMGTWKLLKSLRKEYISSSVPKLNDGMRIPDTLYWGREEWIRKSDLLHESELQNILELAALYYPHFVAGCGDDQCDIYPVGVGFYGRPAQAEGAPLGPKESYAANIEKLYKGIGGRSNDAFEDQASALTKAEPITLSSLLDAVPIPARSIPERSENRVIAHIGHPARRLDQAIWRSCMKCPALVALCIGGTPVFTPLQTLQILEGASRRIADDFEWAGDEDWELPMGEPGDEDTLGINLVEEALKAELLSARGAFGLASNETLAKISAPDYPLHLAWADDALSGEGTSSTRLLDASRKTLYEHNEGLKKLIGEQLAACGENQGEGGESLLYPIMISNSDMLKTVWHGAGQFDNDHEGLNALAFVSKTFAMVVAFKYSSC